MLSWKVLALALAWVSSAYASDDAQIVRSAKPISGLTFEKDTARVNGDGRDSALRAVVRLTGAFESPDTELLWSREGESIAIRPGKIQLDVPLEGTSTNVRFVAIRASGETHSETVKVEFPIYAEFMKREQSRPLHHWLRLEAQVNLLLHSAQAYTVGPGLAFVPEIQRILRVERLSLVPRLEARLSRVTSGALLPILGLGVEARYRLGGRFEIGVGPELGFALQSGANRFFPVALGSFSFLPGFEATLLKVIKLVSVRYSALFSAVYTHEAVLAVTIGLD